MAQVAVTEADIIFVEKNLIREKILQTLSKMKEHISVSDLVKAMGDMKEKKSNVNYHCGKLCDEKLAESITVQGQIYIKITEKGLLTWQEIQRRRKGDQKP